MAILASPETGASARFPLTATRSSPHRHPRHRRGSPVLPSHTATRRGRGGGGGGAGKQARVVAVPGPPPARPGSQEGRRLQAVENGVRKGKNIEPSVCNNRKFPHAASCFLEVNVQSAA